MKKIVKLFMLIVCLCLVTACGPRDNDVNLEKMGTKYTTDNGVSFYYPSDYEVKIDSQNSDIVEFYQEDNNLYFKVIKNETDNVIEDESELYVGEIEENGASKVEVSKPLLDSGLNVYQYVYTYGDTGIKVKEIVYFSVEATYIYGYTSTKDNFDKQDEDMTVYLQSFSKTTGK